MVWVLGINRLCYPFPVDEHLKVNLDNLLIQLRQQVSPFWYQFGEAVGIESEVLDKFAHNCPPQECIVEMFDYWLRNEKELPTWGDIIKTLKVINLQQLAAEIEMVYTTGNELFIHNYYSQMACLKYRETSY